MKKKSFKNLELQKTIVSSFKETAVGGKNNTDILCISVDILCKSRDINCPSKDILCETKHVPCVTDFCY